MKLTHDEAVCGRKRLPGDAIAYTTPCPCRRVVDKPGGNHCAPLRRVTEPTLRVLPRRKAK